MSERELDAVIAAIEERDRLRQELAAARATIDTMQGGYDRAAAMIIGLRHQLAAALENVKDYKENSALFLRQRDEARTDLAAARALLVIISDEFRTEKKFAQWVEAIDAALAAPGEGK